MKKMIDGLLSQHDAGAPQVAQREPVSTVKLLEDTVETMKVVSDKEFTFTMYQVEGGKEAMKMELTYKRK